MNLKEFDKKFKAVLGGSQRWVGFRYIVEDQLKREQVRIVETGSLRDPENWVGDGCSTRIWDWLSTETMSFDTDWRATETTKDYCRSVKAITGDSVRVLREIPPCVTLLYLDSYDYSPGKEALAAMHQLAELAAAWEYLPHGCLIASDDNFGPEKGKGVLVRLVLNMLGIRPELEGYIVVWRKP